MQEADTINSAPRRRALLGSVAAAVTIGAGAAVATPGAAEDEDRAATIEDYAALTFSAEAGTVEECLVPRVLDLAAGF